MNKEIWSKILHIAITILTAITTTFGVTSCMAISCWAHKKRGICSNCISLISSGCGSMKNATRNPQLS